MDIERGHRGGIGRRWLWLVSLAVVAAAVLAALGGLPNGAYADGPLAMRARAVPLDAAVSGPQRVGGLTYAGGLWLSSDDPRFGGLSDLRVSPDGLALRAVSDCGRGFTARLSYAADGTLSGVVEPRVHDLTGLTGRPLLLGEGDSESLVVSGERLEVGFEDHGRVWSYAIDPPFAGPARPVAAPDGLDRCAGNSGLETMTALDADGRLLVCEGVRSPSASVPAWLGGSGGWAERGYPLFFEGGWASQPFRPTAATRLPGGDVLVLERRFPPLAARVVRLRATDLRERGELRPAEVARLEAPLAVDNFEGIDARVDAAGRTLVYLLSDDNNCAKTRGAVRRPNLQRTLLLMFVLEDSDTTPAAAPG